MTARAEPHYFDRWSWLTLAFVLGFGVCCTVVSALILRLPSDGCIMSDYGTGATTPQIVDACYGNWPTTLRHGDKLLAFGQVPISNDIDSAISNWSGNAPPTGWAAGATIPYTVERDGATLVLPVPIDQLSWAEIARVFVYTLGPAQNSLANLVQEYLLYLSAVIIFALAPRNNAARLLLVAFGTQFAFTRLGWGGGPVSSAVAFARGPLHGANYLTNGFWIWGYWPSFILLILSFPRRVWPIARWPRTVPALVYGAPVLVMLVSPIIGVVLFYLVVLLGQFALLFVALVAVTAHTFTRVHDRVVRAQTGWMLLGLSCYFVPLIVLYPFILFDTQFASKLPVVWQELLNLAQIVCGVATPICFGIAITRYRLFDITVVIQRTLVYSLLTLALGSTYVVGVAGLQTLFVRLTGQESALAVVASTLGIAALFVPLRRRIQAIIDRRFFRRKYDGQQVLEQFAQRAQQEADLDALANDIVLVVQDTVQPKEAHVWLVRQ